MDVDARIQLFDLKTRYQFQTTPAVDQYNMPLYSVQTQPGSQSISMLPVYQGFEGPCYINGIEMLFSTLRETFFRQYPNVVQNFPALTTGDGTATYALNTPALNNSSNPPFNGILRGHIDITGIMATGSNIDPPQAATFSTYANVIPSTSVQSQVYITALDATGNNLVISDSGQFLTGNPNYGLLMLNGAAPFGNTSLGTYSTTSNTINYLTGEINVTFPMNIPSGNNINLQVVTLASGLPRTILYYNNTLTLRTVPDSQYLVDMTAYLTPAAFLNTSQAIPFAYMAEYIARGAARKILADTGDIEQFQFYEGLFKEQETLVWKRSQRQFTSTRTPTIYSQGMGTTGNTYYGGY